MTHVSLFSGIGGIDLAAEWAGFTTIAQVEKDDYCQRVLAKHWPDVHRVGDIKDFPDRDYGAVTIVSGGFPCQPFSAAGKREGTADDRHLWPQMLRVIRELAPRWVLAENVPGLLSIEQGMVFETVLADLEREGYTTQAVVVPAAGVGAPHLRYRVFIVGHSAGNGCGPRRAESAEQQGRPSAIGASADVADTYERRCEQRNQDERGIPEFDQDGGYVTDASGSGLEERHGSGPRRTCPAPVVGDWWATQPRVGDLADGFSTWLVEPGIPRVAKGVKDRVNKLRALGNAVVPQQCYPILQAIAEVEWRK